MIVQADTCTATLTTGYRFPQAIAKDRYTDNSEEGMTCLAAGNGSEGSLIDHPFVCLAIFCLWRQDQDAVSQVIRAKASKQLAGIEKTDQGAEKSPEQNQAHAIKEVKPNGQLPSY